MTQADLDTARERLAPHLVWTPLLESEALGERLGCRLWLKLENRQHTGSFKPRGALNKLMSLAGEERERGIVAASAGNHALGVAFAARVLGIVRVDLFVPQETAPAKLAKLARYAVEVHRGGANFDAAQALALAHAAASGATYVSAYDDETVIAGQGTCGLEIVADLPDLDAVLVPVGGGALIAGIALAIKAARPQARVIGVNPAASPSALLSLQAGHAIEAFDNEPTLAHGLAGGFGRVPFRVARGLIDEIVLISEDDMRQAIVALIDTEQVLAEASGAAALAAALAATTKLAGKVAVVISGGNIDAVTLRSILR